MQLQKKKTGKKIFAGLTIIITFTVLNRLIAKQQLSHHLRIMFHLPKGSHFDTNQARKSRNSARFFVFRLKIKRNAITHGCENRKPNRKR